MKNILVTGGAGFIGSHLCEALVKKGHNVVCMDNLSTGNIKNIAHLTEKFKFIKGDANSLEDLKVLFKQYKFDSIFHYAALVGVERTLKNPLAVINDINGIQNILKLANDNGVKEVIYSSSSEVYGEPVENPELEDGHLNAKMPYAVTKLMGEKFMRAYYEEYGLKTVSLRFFNVYGPKQDSSPYGFVVGIFIKQLLGNRGPTVFGDGTQTRDFVYIDDNIEAALKAMDNPKCAGEVINIGSGRAVTILDLAKTLIDMTGAKIEPEIIGMKRDDIKHRCPNVTKMKSLLEFYPAYNLKEGLAKTIEWYKQNMPK